jgi:hypothetical protein
MVKRIASFAVVALLVGCETRPPMLTTPSFVTSPLLAVRNPADIAVLSIEDGTMDHAVARHLELMRQVLMRALPERLYSPLSPAVVDAAIGGENRGANETVLTPGYLRRVAGKSSEDALLAVRVDRWDESSLLTDKRIRFQIQAAMCASDGELLWSGTLAGEVKAGGAGATPLDKETMARSCAELAMLDLLNHLSRRNP